ncbi:hypothetical protein DIPPA_16705 [Diplonema papillatum]|nr:hypothetical protein DIPPA_16705 [Diplonema papillatum]
MASPTVPRVPPRRAPTCPSTTCEVCRAFYKEKRQLDEDLLDVMANFDGEISNRRRAIERLQHAMALWDEQPSERISPDILRAHLMKKQQVLAVLHGALEDEMSLVTKWCEFHRRALEHRKIMAQKNLPMEADQRIYSEAAIREHRMNLMTALGLYRGRRKPAGKPAASDKDDDPNFSLTHLLEDDDSQGGGGEATRRYPQLWFHQDQADGSLSRKAVAISRRRADKKLNMVTEAEDCSRRIRAQRLHRLQREAKVLAARLRDEVTGSGERKKVGDGPGDRKTRLRTAVERELRKTAAAPRAAEPALAVKARAEAQLGLGAGGERASTASLSSQASEQDPPDDFQPEGYSQRAVCDNTFWRAVTRAQTMPNVDLLETRSRSPNPAALSTALAGTPQVDSILRTPARLDFTDFITRHQRELALAQKPVVSAVSGRARSVLEAAKAQQQQQQQQLRLQQLQQQQQQPQQPQLQPTVKQGLDREARVRGPAGSRPQSGTLGLPPDPLAAAAARLQAAQRAVFASRVATERHA